MKKTTINKKKNFCYKSILLEDGIALLFEKFSPFKEEEIKINYFSGDIYIEFGDNVFLLTKNMMDKLLTKPKLFICVGRVNEYETLGYEGYFEVDTSLLAQIKGAILVLETQEKSQKAIPLKEDSEKIAEPEVQT